MTDASYPDPPGGDPHYDAVVIGAGLMGCATAWHLARAGKRIALLDRRPDPTSSSFSSRGHARMTRSLAPPGDISGTLHSLCLQDMRLLAEEAGTTCPDLYTTSTLSYFFYGGQGQGQGFYDSIVPHLPGYCKLHHGAAEAESPKLSAGPWDALGISACIRETHGGTGTLNPDAVLQALLGCLEKRGAEILWGCRVSGVDFTTPSPPASSGVSVSFENCTPPDGAPAGVTRRISADHCVWAGGAQPPPAGRVPRGLSAVAGLVTPARVPLFFFRTPEAVQGGCVDPSDVGFPAVHFTEDLEYLMVEHAASDSSPAVVKIGGHFKRTPLSPAELQGVWDAGVTSEEIAWASSRMAAHLRLHGLDVPAGVLQESCYAGGVSCVYSLAPGEVPIVSPVPGSTEGGAVGGPDPRIVYIGGMSGTGAKGCLAYGRLAASYVLGGAGAAEAGCAKEGGGGGGCGGGHVSQHLIDALGFRRVAELLQGDGSV